MQRNAINLFVLGVNLKSLSLPGAFVEGQFNIKDFCIVIEVSRHEK